MTNGRPLMPENEIPETERCPAELTRGNPNYQCILQAGHGPKHRDQYDNTWSMTIIVDGKTWNV